MTNSLNNLIAGVMTLNIDYERIEQEMLLLLEKKKCTQFSDPSIKSTAHSAFLRKSYEIDTELFSEAKLAKFDSWSWDNSLDIPYTRSVFDSIPMKPLGMVVVAIYRGIPMHTDWNDPTDIKHTLGLNLIANQGNTCVKVWYEKENRYVPITGNAILFNDSFNHVIPDCDGTRITVRAFGEIDHAWFNDKLDSTQCYYF